MLTDLTGQKFNRLTVMEYAGKTKNRISLWLCICECNKQIIYKKLWRRIYIYKWSIEKSLNTP